MNVLDITIKVFLAGYVLFLPGLVLSFLFFEWKKIDIIERIALSFALSIAIVPLIVFYTNLLGIKITAPNVALQILFVIMLTCIALLVKELIRIKRKKHKQ